jgi:hypothetical protein
LISASDSAFGEAPAVTVEFTDIVSYIGRKGVLLKGFVG